FNALANRRDPASGFEPPILKALLISLVPFALIVLATELPGLQRGLLTTSLTGKEWLACFGLAALLPVVIEAGPRVPPPPPPPPRARGGLARRRARAPPGGPREARPRTRPLPPPPAEPPRAVPSRPPPADTSRVPETQQTDEKLLTPRRVIVGLIVLYLILF